MAPTPSFTKYFMEIGRPAKRLVCCCFRTTRICISFFIIVIVLLAVAAYFLFPSVPSVDVGGAFIPPGQTVSFSGSRLTAGSFSLSLPIAYNVTVSSTAYINIGIRQIKVESFVLDNSGNKIPNFIGSGSVKDLKFPARQKIGFTFPLVLVFNTTIVSSLSDPVINLLKANCIEAPENQRTLPTRITLTLEISAISWLGIWPSFSFDKASGCPTDQLKQLLL
jgi:hypothetical protein